VLAILFLRIPTGFLPEEDQGQVLVQFSLPPGAVAARTGRVVEAIEHQLFDVEKANVKGGFVTTGFSFGGSGQNLGLAFVQLKDWSERKGPQNSAAAIARRAMGAFSRIRDAQVFAFVPPSVRELGNANGFDFELEDVGGVGHEALVAARNQLLGMAAGDPKLFAVRPNGQEDAPTFHVDVDRAKAGALGLNLADVDATLSTAWGSTYINQFVDRGRVKKVFMQGDAPYRAGPADLDRWFVRTGSGTMAPFTAFSTGRWTLGPTRLEHYNGNPSMELQGMSAPGFSSGAAMEEMVALSKRLPPGVGYEWTGLSFQEEISGAQAPALYALSLLAVFLCLAALYESWSVPAAVMLIIPLGVVGALIAATLRGLYNDIYFQVGLLTTIGLSAKNAILIVEFAVAWEKEGATPLEAAVHAAKIRLRPVLMTSLAFIAGVFPLAISSGAGAGSQNDIGTGVIGGMLAATVLAIFFVPMFFVLVRGAFRSRRRGLAPAPSRPQEG
jgi:multidrug efflux pump